MMNFSHMCEHPSTVFRKRWYGIEYKLLVLLRSICSVLVCTVHMELCLQFSTIRWLLKGFHTREATVNKNEKAVVCIRGNVLLESWYM